MTPLRLAFSANVTNIFSILFFKSLVKIPIRTWAKPDSYKYPSEISSQLISEPLLSTLRVHTELGIWLMAVVPSLIFLMLQMSCGLVPESLLRSKCITSISSSLASRPVILSKSNCNDQKQYMFFTVVAIQLLIK